MYKQAFVLVILLALGAAAAGYFVAQARSSDSPASAAAQSQADAANVRPKLGPTLTLSERILNLSSSPTLPRYVKLELVLEFESTDKNQSKASANLIKDLQPEMPVLDDAVNNIVSAKTADQLSTAGGKDRLKREIMDTLNGVVGGPKVVNVYFTRFVIQ